MSDRPTTPPVPTPDPAELPSRSLSEILEELALLSHAQAGEASEMRSAVSELSRSLARLFEMIRSDRADQRVRIAELERDLKAARDQLAALGVEPVVAPAPNDFDQLRAAAERLRARTEQLVREAALADAVAPVDVDPPVIADADAGTAPESPAGDGLEAKAAGGAVAETAGAAEDVAGVGDPPAPSPGVFRVIEGSAADEPAERPAEADAPAPGAPDLEVESELPIARAVALPVLPLGGSTPEPAPAPEGPRPGLEEPAELAEPAASAETAATADAAARPASRPEPIAVAPREARRRGVRPRRRRIDARKLDGVEPAAALGSMVGAIPLLWTASCPVDLVVAFTDGGAVRVSGGDRVPLRVEEVEPGTPARCTVTATRRQVVPLFGRLTLTADESAPLIHGSRRDADLLVGWIDRAQRLRVEPL